MKTVRTIIKIVTALAAIAGVIYVIATYGDKIVAWAKKLLKGSCCCCCDSDDCCTDATVAETNEAEEVVQAAPVSEETVQAEESDFEK